MVKQKLVRKLIVRFCTGTNIFSYSDAVVLRRES